MKIKWRTLDQPIVGDVVEAVVEAAEEEMVTVVDAVDVDVVVAAAAEIRRRRVGCP